MGNDGSHKSMSNDGRIIYHWAMIVESHHYAKTKITNHWVTIIESQFCGRCIFIDAVDNDGRITHHWVMIVKSQITWQ